MLTGECPRRKYLLACVNTKFLNKIKSIKVIKTVFYCLLLTALRSGTKLIPIHNTFINT